MKKQINTFKHNLRSLLSLVVAIQIAFGAPMAMASSEEQVSAEFTAKVMRFVGSYKKRFQSAELNELEVAKLIESDRFDGVLNSWGRNAMSKTEAEDSFSNYEKDQKLNALRGEASLIIDELFRDSFFSRQKPDPATFNRYLFELFSIYVREPDSRPALELFFDVLREKRFSNEQLKQMDKNKTILGNVASGMNLWVFFGGAGVILASKRWPKSKALSEKVLERFDLALKAPAKKAAEATGFQGFYQRNISPSIQSAQSFFGGLFKKKAAKPAAEAPVLRLPSPQMIATKVKQTERNEVKKIAAAMIQNFEKKNGRKMNEAEHKQMVQILAQTLRNLRALKIQDEQLIRMIMQKHAASIQTQQKAPTVAQLSQTRENILKTYGQFANKKIESSGLVHKTKKKVIKISSVAAEFTLRNSQRLLNSTPKEMARDMGRFLRLWGTGVGAYAAVMTSYYQFDNTQFTLVPESELDKSVRAMAILELTCRSEKLSSRSQNLARMVDMSTEPAQVNQAMAPLVTELNRLASDYALMTALGAQFTNDVESVIQLPHRDLEFNKSTNQVVYKKEHEGQVYEINFACPTRAGKGFQNISLNEAQRALERAKDQLTVVDALNEVTVESSEAQVERTANRLLALNVKEYNQAVTLLVDRLYNQDASVVGVIDLIDRKLADANTRINGEPISQRSKRLTASRLIDQRNARIQKAQGA